MPTKRAVFLFFFSLIILLGAWASKLVWVYYAFSSTIALILLSYLFSRLIIINLEVKRELPERAYEDEVITIFIKVRNRIPILDQSVEIQDFFTAGENARRIKTMYLNGLSEGKVQFSYQERCFKRGRYRIGPFLIKIFDPLGLFYYQREVPEFSSLTVYPRLFPVHSLPFVLGHLAPRFGEQTTRISGDYEEFYGIREYQQEDGWRRIHWRSTARLNELMVRHFEQSSQWKSILVLDASSQNESGFGKENTFEYAIKVLASLMKYLLERNASFGLLSSTKEPLYTPIDRGNDHYYRILESLAAIQADGQMEIEELIARYQWGIPASSSIIFATPKYNDSLLKLLKQIKLKKNVGLIPIILNSNSFQAGTKKIDNTTRAVGIKKVFNELSSQAYVVNCRDNLEMYFLK